MLRNDGVTFYLFKFQSQAFVEFPAFVRAVVMRWVCGCAEMTLRSANVVKHTILQYGLSIISCGGQIL